MLTRAYRYCEWITAHHYENFPVASWLLPARLRPHVAAIYAFARAADDFADEKKYEGRSLELLERWRKSLWDHSDHPIFIALSNTIREFNLPVQLLDDLLTAFTLDVTKRRYSDWDDLLMYCRYSANPVGRLVLALFGIRDAELERQSDCICTGLQLANHWQDLARDLARDMLYIPQDLMRQYGVTETELTKYANGAGKRSRTRSTLVSRSERTPVDGDSRPRSCGTAPRQEFRTLLAELVTRARRLFDEGEPLVGHLSGGLRLEIKLTVLGGRAILDRIEKSDYDVFRHRPTISTFDKIGLLTRAVLSR